MHFRVSIPPNVKAGQVIRIRCPDGTEGDVKVPKGLKPGDTFVFDFPAVKGLVPKSKKKTTSSSFLDREIASAHDFVMALAIGVIIGLSIVTGFLLGVLYVTDPEDALTSS